MEKLHSGYPDDTAAATFHAAAPVNLSNRDDWTTEGQDRTHASVNLDEDRPARLLARQNIFGLEIRARTLHQSLISALTSARPEAAKERLS
ncbi:MAG: hypothetical protein HXY20_01825 [Acidobacteria bacterium]|nr:hypothetical protein [Acidobacteriota bacterium]